MVNGDSIRVTVVDDDPHLCKAVGRMLNASGFKCVTYNSAESFLDSQAYLHTDCLILDVHLGGITGFDLMRHMSRLELANAVPVIFITAYDEPTTREQAQRAGCSAYLRKIDSGQAVIEAIKRAVNGRANDRRPEPVLC